MAALSIADECGSSLSYEHGNTGPDQLIQVEQAMPRSASAGIELIVHSTERLALQFAGRDVDNN